MIKNTGGPPTRTRHIVLFIYVYINIYEAYDFDRMSLSLRMIARCMRATDGKVGIVLALGTGMSF